MDYLNFTPIFSRRPKYACIMHGYLSRIDEFRLLGRGRALGRGRGHNLSENVKIPR